MPYYTLINNFNRMLYVYKANCFRAKSWFRNLDYVFFKMSLQKTQKVAFWGFQKNKQESCAIAKMTAQCALHMGALKVFGTPWLRPRHYFQHFYRLLFRSTLWMFLQNLKSVALPVPEIIGGTPKNWTVPRYGHAPFSPKKLTGFYSDRPYKYTRQIWSP